MDTTNEINAVKVLTPRQELKSIVDVKKIKLDKIKIKFDITTLNMTIAFIFKDTVLRNRKSMNNLYKIFSNIDTSKYENEPELINRIWVILKVLDARLFKNITTSDDYIIEVLKDDKESDSAKESIVNEIPKLSITHDESKYLVNKYEDILRYGYIMTVLDIYKSFIDYIEDGNYKTYQQVEEDCYNLCSSFINIYRESKSMGSDNEFSLDADVFDTVVEDAVKKLKDRNRIFVTGIQRLNTLLSPGLLAKRLYMFMAFPSKGKSTMLLKMAIDIRRYNKVVPKQPDKQVAVLMLTLENDITETVERLYNMTTDTDDIRNYTPKQIQKKMKKQVKLELTEDNNINIIIKEYKNRELDTNDIYGIINDMNDQGVEVIALIIDYIKRIRPAEKGNSEKEELKNISNELKELAKFYDIPVITAQQLNRTGAAVVDAALQANKDDVTRLVGRDAIGGAWELLENADWTCIINQEIQQDTGKLFMTFKQLKKRYRSIEANDRLRRLDYFNQPFEEGSEIRLVDDIEMENAVALESLSTKFEAVPNNTAVNATERKKINDTTNPEFEAFDFDKSNY